MAQGNAAKLLTSVDSLFTTQEERDQANCDRVINLPPSQISLFPDRPYKVWMDEDMVELVENVKTRGVILPALVRPMPDGTYQMVSGQRRKYATELAGLPTLPCIVRELTDDEAIIIMVDSNIQRERALPSEKAFAYKMKLEALQRRQGERTDLTSATPLQKLNVGSTRELLAQKSGESHEQIRKYVRLTNLIPEILAMVDNKRKPGKDLFILSRFSLLQNGLVITPPIQNSMDLHGVTRNDIKHQVVLYYQVAISFCSKSQIPGMGATLRHHRQAGNFLYEQVIVAQCHFFRKGVEVICNTRQVLFSRGI